MLALGVLVGVLCADRIGESTSNPCIGTFMLVSHRRLDNSFVSMHFNLATRHYIGEIDERATHNRCC